MSIRIFVPLDAGALAVGVDDVAIALAQAGQAHGIEIVRTGSRGLYWLEPMIEIATAAGRVAYGPVSASDVPSHDTSRQGSLIFSRIIGLRIRSLWVA
ncbi:hypothetical protein ES703_99821 [subsurface metagenome]